MENLALISQLGFPSHVAVTFRHPPEDLDGKVCTVNGLDLEGRFIFTNGMTAILKTDDGRLLPVHVANLKFRQTFSSYDMDGNKVRKPSKRDVESTMVIDDLGADLFSEQATASTPVVVGSSESRI